MANDQPGAVPGMLMPKSAVVAGVLTKYANIAKGWRDRLFVMSDGKLVYFKLSGHNRVDVTEVLDSYDPSRSNTRLIGAKVFFLQKESGRNGKAPSKSIQERALGCYTLERAKLRASGTESHKFYVNVGGQPMLTIKTETPDDRVAWMTALDHGKATSLESAAAALPRGFGAAWPGELVHANSLSQAEAGSAALMAALKDTHGVSADACSAVQTHLVSLHRKLSMALQQLGQSNDAVSRLMDDKRVLETGLVAASTGIRGGEQVTSSSRGEEEGEDDTEAEMSFHGGWDEGSDASAEHCDTPAFVSGKLEVDGDVFYDSRPSHAQMPARRRGSTGKLPPAAAAAPVRSSTFTSGAPVAVPRGAAAAEGTGTVVDDEGEPRDESEMLQLSWLQDEPNVSRRKFLPKPEEEQKSVSLWAIIKEAVGKDLTRICLPVYFNEPLSALQKMAEEFEYSYLIDRAARCPKGSVERLSWVAAFSVSGYAGTVGRTCKPFNPLLAETYELVAKDRGFRFVAEKVIHHPTVLAAYGDGRGWSASCDIEVKSKFWGRCIELKPVGRLEISFDDGEIVHWNKVTSTINNLIIGKIYIQHGGTSHIHSNCTQDALRIKFKDGGWTTSKRDIVGSLQRNGKEVHGYRLHGQWDKSLTLDDGNGQREVWKASAPAPDPTRYNLSQFAIQLNELTPGLKDKLPPTDCRLRPDQAALEAGRYDLANAEKQRLEQKQRRARKEAEEGKPLHPRWFDEVKGVRRGEALTFKFNNEYWQARQAGKYTNCRDIFAVDTEP